MTTESAETSSDENEHRQPAGASEAADGHNYSNSAGCGQSAPKSPEEAASSPATTEEVSAEKLKSLEVTDINEDPAFIEADSDLLDDVPQDTEDLDLTHLRIQSLKSLRLGRFPSVKSACFRQNIITSLRGLEDLPADLEGLDLYDNRIEKMDKRLEHFNKSMNLLDLSFNNIRQIKHIDCLTGLKDLFLCQNAIHKISGLENLTQLTNLELGANKIREIQGLDNLVNLEKLWLARNKITQLQGLDKLVNLKLLSIQSNRITKLENLDKLVNLEELYVSHNGIEKIEGLENNMKLTILDIGNNRIKQLDNLETHEALEELWASSNQLSDFGNIERQLRHLPKFNTIYLEHNPLQVNSGPTYRNKVRLALGPTLVQIDATPVRSD